MAADVNMSCFLCGYHLCDVIYADVLLAALKNGWHRSAVSF